MMRYDFDELTDRRHTGALKWDVADNELPMWVADMDFKTAACVTEAIDKRAREGIFGYSIITDEWYEAYMTWWRDRHGFEIDRSWMIFATGVVPILSSVVRKLTTPAENVLVQTPVYNIFYNSILNNGRNVIENPLLYDGENYAVDFDDLERKLSNPQTTMMILCNPHNPIGKIWDSRTLAKIGELCAKYNVCVISDEIHCDLTEPGREYVPFASVSDKCRDNCVMCVAPTKTFNIAGIQTAAAIVPNEFIRHKVWRGLNTDEVAEPNAFAVAATVAAYGGGGEWLDELRSYLWQNRELVGNYLEKNIPDIKLVRSDATYLLWLDCGRVAGDSTELARFIRRETGLYLSDGKEYGADGSFLRMNIACPNAYVSDGLQRLKRGVKLFLANR